MKVFVFYHDETEVDIFVEDGGVGCLHYNGEYILASYYQSRLKPEELKEDEEFWDVIGQGKIYHKEYQEQFVVTDEMIEDTIQWLGFDLSEVEIIKETDPEKYPIK